MSPRINFFKQLKAFYEGVWHGEKDFTPSHVSLYFFLVNQNNRNEWAEWFKVALDLGMKGSCIGTKKTYYKTLEDLAEWGYIRYEKGANAWKSPKISIIPLCSNGKRLPDMPEVEVSNDTAMVDATVTATIPLPLPQVSTLGYPNKDYNTNTRPKTTKQAPFIPPTPEEVKSYAEENGITNTDLKEWFLTRKENEWVKANGQPVKNWRLDLRTADRRGYYPKKVVY